MLKRFGYLRLHLQIMGLDACFDRDKCWYELHRTGMPARPMFDIDIDEYWDEDKRVKYIADFLEKFGKLYEHCFEGKTFDAEMQARVLDSSVS